MDEQTNENIENVKVVVRCRPPTKETPEEKEISVRVDESNGTIEVPGRVFTFDRTFGFESTQSEVYEEASRAIIDSVLEGYNGTIFAYGQTGTGKTFTSSGILDHIFRHVFDFISTSMKDTQFLVRASYYEIYNEEIRDLLKKGGKNLELKESGNLVYVKNLSCYVVNDVQDLHKLKTLGDKHRIIAATNMNLRSSRSHTVFTITIEMIRKDPLNPNGTLRVGKCNIVDLAGSERQNKTGAQGDRLKEAAKINLSLTSLSLVIAALTDAKATHIPYRNSKLTRILSDSLGGNSKTLLIACIGPGKSNIDESLSTLRFASTAKKIKNKTKINEDSKDTLLRKFQEQIDELKKQLEAQENGHDGHHVHSGHGHGSHQESSSSDAAEKLKQLEKKILMGEELARTDQELTRIQEKKEALAASIEAKRVERMEMEESYGSLQEEVIGINKKLKKVFTYFTAAKEELTDCDAEFANLKEDLVQSIRATQKEIKLADFIIHHTIPAPYYHLIQDRATYNESIGEWNLKGIAYAGNNIDQVNRCR